MRQTHTTRTPKPHTLRSCTGTFTCTSTQAHRHTESWDETRLFCSGECESPLQSVVEWMRHAHTQTQTDTNPRLQLNTVTHWQSTFLCRALNSAGDVLLKPDLWNLSLPATRLHEMVWSSSFNINISCHPADRPDQSWITIGAEKLRDSSVYVSRSSMFRFCSVGLSSPSDMRRLFLLVDTKRTLYTRNTQDKSGTRLREALNRLLSCSEFLLDIWTR